MIENAKAIWIDKNSKNQYIDAEYEFEYNGGEAAVEICADTDCSVYVNGSFVGCGQYLTFPGKKAFETYDISSYVHSGKNLLFVTAYAQVEGSSTYKCDTPMLAFAIKSGEKIYYSDENTRVRENAAYKSGEIEKVSNQLGYTYHYDANATERPWERPKIVEKKFNYTKRPVKKLVFKDFVGGKIIAQGRLIREECETVGMTMQNDFLSYSRYGIIDNGTVNKQTGGVYFVIDLGREYAGLLNLKLTAGKGTVIDVGWGENLDDMRVRAYVGGRNFAVRYICRGGNQEFLGCFRRMGARYLQVHITNMTSDVKLERIGLIPTDYPLNDTRKFDFGDYLLNEIMNAADRTLRLCVHEHYEDCPWREQALYAYDSYIQMLCGYFMYGEFDQAKAALELFADGQRADGMLEICAPSDADLTIPSFSLHWICSLEAYMNYSGDVDFVEKMTACASKILKAYKIKDGIVQLNTSKDCWNFYEWTDGVDGCWNAEEQTFGVVDGKTVTDDALCNFLYIMAAQAYNNICLRTGRKDMCDVEDVKSAVREKYYNRENGLWRTMENDERYHMLTQSLAYCSGVDKSEQLLEKIASGDGLIDVTMSTSLFKYEALLSAGNKYRAAVKDEIARVWGSILLSGSQTFWETANGADDFEYAGSMCHGWSAVPAYLLAKYYAENGCGSFAENERK